MERIEHDLQVLSHLKADNPRMFFLGENSFCLPSAKLLEIMGLARAYIPRVNSFAMYARIDDIARKSDEELARLRRAGLNALHIGLESGCDTILEAMDKGVSAQDAILQLQRLDDVGILYHVTLVGGLGGRKLSWRHALDTAHLLNQIHPMSVWVLKLNLFEGTPLYEEHQRGEFDLMEPAEVLREEIALLEHLEHPEFVFMDTTVLNTYSLVGKLPERYDTLLTAAYFLLSQEFQEEGLAEAQEEPNRSQNDEGALQRPAGRESSPKEDTSIKGRITSAPASNDWQNLLL